MSSTITALTSGGGLSMAGDTSGQLELKTNNGTTAVTIDTSQNVSIGTTTPLVSSAGRGNVTINGSTDAVLAFGNGGTNSAYIFNNSGQLELAAIGSRTINFTNNGSERMRIDSNGALLVGATSQYGSEKFNVTSSSSANGARTINIYNSSASSTTKLNNVITRISSNGNGADNCINLTDNVANNYYFGGNNGGAYVVSSSNGVRLTVNATSWSSDSDERVKDIIEPINDAIDKVSSLRAVIGKYKTDAEGVRRSFLIAQDVQKVLPEAVCDEQGTLMLAYTDVIPLLVASIKELSARVDAQALEIKALKGVA